MSVNLKAAVPGQNPNFPQIVTSSTGQYVYSIWRKATRIQVAISSDFGATFQDPVSTPAGSPNLSASGHNANSPQIITDDTGQYVYAVWRLFDGPDKRIQVAISSDFGVTFQNPTATPASDGPPNLSNPGQNAETPQIVTNSTGQYVYAVWRKSHGSERRAQVAISSDFGITFQDPTVTPATDGPPNLSPLGLKADIPQITTNSTGEYVYATWRAQESKKRVQVAICSDFGVTFQDPTTTSAPDGPPNLSNPDENAQENQVITDNTGQYVYAVWRKSQGAVNSIRVSTSSNFGVDFQEIDVYMKIDIDPLGTEYEYEFPLTLDLRFMTQRQFKHQMDRIINHIKERM
ncbi:MAG: sialidase family protein [Candidatus Thorarchaeota archaeon]